MVRRKRKTAERKREKAREDGQVASSKVPSAALLAVATLSFMVMGQNILTAAQACRAS